MSLLPLFLLRSASSILSALLGGVGVFCLIESFWAPHLAMHALIMLGTATAIVRFLGR
jgi:hypothetical protein